MRPCSAKALSQMSFQLKKSCRDLAQWLRTHLPMQETRVQSLRQEDPLEEATAAHSMDRGAWWATVHAVAQSRIQLSAHTHTQCGARKPSLADAALHTHS